MSWDVRHDLSFMIRGDSRNSFRHGGLFLLPEELFLKFLRILKTLNHFWKNEGFPSLFFKNEGILHTFPTIMNHCLWTKVKPLPCLETHSDFSRQQSIVGKERGCKLFTRWLWPLNLVKIQWEWKHFFLSTLH